MRWIAHTPRPRAAGHGPQAGRGLPRRAAARAGRGPARRRAGAGAARRADPRRWCGRHRRIGRERGRDHRRVDAGGEDAGAARLRRYAQRPGRAGCARGHAGWRSDPGADRGDRPRGARAEGPEPGFHRPRDRPVLRLRGRGHHAAGDRDSAAVPWAGICRRRSIAR